MGGGKGGSKKVTVGHHYYMDIHFALAGCEIDEIHEIRIGDRTAWRGSQVGSGTLMTSQSKLFGGEAREGGVGGLIDVMTGHHGQPINPSLVRSIANTFEIEDPVVPAYRGMTTVFFKGFNIEDDMSGTVWDEANPGTLQTDVEEFESNNSGSFLHDVVKAGMTKVVRNAAFYWAAMNPYFKVPHFLVSRYFTGWYYTRAKIGEDMNPAHIIYETLTNKRFGLGNPVSDIDDQNFRDFADLMHSEGFGLSLSWANQMKGEEFISSVLRHVNASLVENRETGLWQILPIRDDVDINNLLHFNEDNCMLESFERTSISDTINEVIVTYTNPSTGEPDTIVAHDLANFANTGRINSQKMDYRGITRSSVASKVAQRDLQTLSKPLSKIAILTDRSATKLYPGLPFLFSDELNGLNGVVYRVVKMDIGDFHANKILIDAVEDVFTSAPDAYTFDAPIEWVPEIPPARAVETVKVDQLTYYELMIATTAADRLEWTDDTEFTRVLAVPPQSGASEYELLDDLTETNLGRSQFTPSVPVAETVNPWDTSFEVDVSESTDLYDMLEGGLALLGDELVVLTEFNYGTRTFTCLRGAIDTVPTTHLPGTMLYFLDGDDYAPDPVEKVPGEVVEYKLLTVTRNEILSASSAPVVTDTVVERYSRPYPPGQFRINGVSFLSEFEGDVSISWAHRDRTQQLAGIPTHNEGSIGPETNVTYNLEIRDENDQVLTSQLGITGELFNFSSATQGSLRTFNSYAPSGIFEKVGETTVRDPWVNLKMKEDLSSQGTTATSQHTGISPNKSINLYNISDYTRSSLYGEANGGSYAFSGNSYIRVNDSSINGVNEFALRAIVSPTLQTLMYIAVKGNDIDGSQLQDWSWAIRIPTDGSIYVLVCDGTTYQTFSTPAGVVSAYTAHHILLNVKSDSVEIIVDGTEHSFTRTVGAVSASETNALYIGCEYENNARKFAFDGDMDDVQFFNHSLTDAEATLLYSDYQNGGGVFNSNQRLSSELRIRLESERDGLTSLQQYDFVTKRKGFGFNFGSY